MFKLVAKLGVCLLVLGLQGGLSFAVSAAPISEDWQATDQDMSNQEQESLVRKQQEVRRHEQAMLQQDDETSPDWQWRQWLEREDHIRNMQILQTDKMNFVGASPIWRVSSVHRP